MCNDNKLHKTNSWKWHHLRESPTSARFQWVRPKHIMTHQQKIAHAISRFQIKNAHCRQEPSTENLLTVRFPLCSSANDSASAALGICMDIYSKSDSTAMLLALRLATRPARRQADYSSSLLESMLALPEGWGSTWGLISYKIPFVPNGKQTSGLQDNRCKAQCLL